MVQNEATPIRVIICDVAAVRRRVVTRGRGQEGTRKYGGKAGVEVGTGA